MFWRKSRQKKTLNWLNCRSWHIRNSDNYTITLISHCHLHVSSLLLYVGMYVCIDQSVSVCLSLLVYLLAYLYINLFIRDPTEDKQFYLFIYLHACLFIYLHAYYLFINFLNIYLFTIIIKYRYICLFIIIFSIFICLFNFSLFWSHFNAYILSLLLLLFLEKKSLP